MTKTMDKMIYLTVVSPDQDFTPALQYASLKAKKNTGVVGLVYAIAPSELRMNAGVEELVLEERRKEAEDLLMEIAGQIKKVAGRAPMIFVREGSLKDQTFLLLAEEQNTAQLVLGSQVNGESVEVFLSNAQKKMSAAAKPVLVVPDSMTEEQVKTYLKG